MRISVLDVGDGACSVMRSTCPWHEADLAVIDCGSNNLGANFAVRRLLDEVDDRPEDITTVVVTHFDMDHYLGLLRLAKWMKKNRRKFRRLNLIAPRPPEEEPEFTLAYLSLASYKTGVLNLDLAEALQKVTESGRFTYTPIYRGGPDFWAADSRYSVHWPPRFLPTGLVSNVHKAMTLYKDLADELKKRGMPELENNLRIAREGKWLKPDASQEVASDFDKGNLDSELFREDSVYGEPDEPIDHADVQNIRIPDDLRGEFKRAWDAFRGANNNMSIVFDDYQKGLVVFGDAEPPVLRWLAQSQELAFRYEVMLAPHHGTHVLPREFNTQARICISQNGYDLVEHWWKHRESHNNYHSCKSTIFGNYHVYLGARRCCWC